MLAPYDAKTGWIGLPLTVRLLLSGKKRALGFHLTFLAQIYKRRIYGGLVCAYTFKQWIKAILLTCHTNGRFFRLITARTNASVFHDMSEGTEDSAWRRFSSEKESGMLDMIMVIMLDTFKVSVSDTPVMSRG